MTSRLTETVIDSSDPTALADFWCRVLGYVVLHEGDDYVEIGPAKVPDTELLEGIRRGPVAPALLFVPVPEAKARKNRLHLDLTPIDGSQADEVARLEALGAHRVDIGQGQTKWVVLADPEGNEFCVLRSLAPGEFELPADGAAAG
ncbi:VOC family protein [Nocardioides endophyticus]|uniref:VOC family protein n=1 Tax=Nocardioides endophyticus TaxID=1353775 RepID=A0ABP8YCA2_9ACTN